MKDINIFQTAELKIYLHSSSKGHSCWKAADYVSVIGIVNFPVNTGSPVNYP